MPWGWDNYGHETFSSDDDIVDKDIVYRVDEPLSNEYMSEIASGNNKIFIKKYNFNSPLENLPHTCKELFIYSNDFNQPLDNLPYGIEKITLKGCVKFNQPVDNLPPTLKHLCLISQMFNQSIDNLPLGLEKLHINSKYFNQRILQLPDKLDDLTIMNDEFTEIIENFPDGLKSLNLAWTGFNNVIDKLPAKLELLWLPFDYKVPLPGKMPVSLKFFHVPQLGLQYLDKKPDAMEVIDIDAKQAFNNVEKMQNANRIYNASNKKIMLNIVSSSGLSIMYTRMQPYTNDTAKRWDFINFQV